MAIKEMNGFRKKAVPEETVETPRSSVQGRFVTPRVLDVDWGLAPEPQIPKHKAPRLRRTP